MDAFHASQLAHQQPQQLRFYDPTVPLHPDGDPCETKSSLAGESDRRMLLYIAGMTVSAGALVGFVFWITQTEIRLAQNGAHTSEYSKEGISRIDWMVHSGASLMSFLGQKFFKMIGRKWAILSMIVPLLIGWLFINFGKNEPLLMIGQFFLGVAGGTFCLHAPTYTAQIEQSWMQETLGTLWQLLVIFGTLFVFGVIVAVNILVMTIVCGAVPLVFGVVFFMPKRLSYYINHSHEQAYQIPEIAELGVVENICEKMKTFFHNFNNRATIRLLIISMGLMFFQQLSGIEAVIFYTTDIFQDASISLDATISTIIVGAIQIVALFLTTAIVNKVSRRILLMISAIFMAISTTILAVYSMRKTNDATQVQNLGWIAILAVCLFIAMYSIGYGPIPLLMVGELCASNANAYAWSLTGGFNWLLALVVTKFFTYLRGALDMAKVFWLFSSLSLLGAVFVFFVVPETRGVTLAEIRWMLSGEDRRMLSGEEVQHSSIQSNPNVEDDDEPLLSGEEVQHSSIQSNPYMEDDDKPLL